MFSTHAFVQIQGNARRQRINESSIAYAHTRIFVKNRSIRFVARM
jgi:hypothetical protein